MKKNGQITGFYLETLLLIVVFIAIILVLTQVFGLAQVQSSGARELTDAVILAGNTAEAVSMSRTVNELLEILNENGNAELLLDNTGLSVRYGTDRKPDPEGIYRVNVNWLPEESDSGTLIRSLIQVCCRERQAPVYELETEVFLQGVDA